MHECTAVDVYLHNSRGEQRGKENFSIMNPGYTNKTCLRSDRYYIIIIAHAAESYIEAIDLQKCTNKIWDKLCSIYIEPQGNKRP